jgi:hypothetical protein
VNPANAWAWWFGIGFDFEATNFHLRWQLFTEVRRWNRMHGLNLDETAMDQWLESLRDQCGPPLTPPRVMGALGGIVASRMAREFRFGGSQFRGLRRCRLRGQGASGCRRPAAAGTADAMLVGAVDLAGEGRSVVRMDHFVAPFPHQGGPPFRCHGRWYASRRGCRGTGAQALARRRIDDDRIYAVIRSIGSAGGDDPTKGRVGQSTYRRSLSQCFRPTDVSVDSVSYVEAHGAGVPDQDRMEIAALADFFPRRPGPTRQRPLLSGSTKPIAGYTGAADGLISLAKTALVPASPRSAAACRVQAPAIHPRKSNRFHMPNRAQPWYRDRERGPEPPAAHRSPWTAAAAMCCFRNMKPSPPRRHAPVLPPTIDTVPAFSWSPGTRRSS